MQQHDGFHAVIREAAASRVLYLPHAVRQMTRPDRMISPGDVRAVLSDGVIIENYPEDVRGHSALLLGFPNGRAVHVVCSPKDGYVAVITAYLPDIDEWESDFIRRRV